MTTACPATTVPEAQARRPARSVLLSVLLLVGFTAAVALRSAVGGAAVARSTPAALVFAAVLLGFSWLPGRWWARQRPRGVAVGLIVGVAGAAVLCLPAVLHRAAAASGGRPAVGFLGWAVVVTVVASGEEVFLRGALYRLLEPFGVVVAIGVPALAFAALHVPLYGWGALPLDLAVGVWLGALRAVSGSALAPAVAHVLADWAAWGLL